MAGFIETKFNQYKIANPLYTKEAIVDLMVEDGVITKDTGDKIKSGISLFLLEDDKFKIPNADSNEIFGGYFSKNISKVENSQAKTHKLSSLVEVDDKGEILESQFSFEAIKKKYASKDYNVSKEEDDSFGLTTIEVTDKNGKKVAEYCYSELNEDRYYDITLFGYDKKSGEDFIKEDVNIIEFNGSLKITSIKKHTKEESNFILYNIETGEIKKVSHWGRNKDGIMDIQREVFYSNNKPYKTIEGTETICNEIVDRLEKIFAEDKTKSPFDYKIGDDYRKQQELSDLIFGITQRNVFEVLQDYQTQTGRDLLDDINKMIKEADSGSIYTKVVGKNMLKHLDKNMEYSNLASRDGICMHNAEKYIANRLVKDLQNGDVESFKKSLKYCGINLEDDEKGLSTEIFGNPLIINVLLEFQKASGSGAKKGLLSTIAQSEKINPEERAEILLDIITQINFSNEQEIHDEIYNFSQSNEFMDLMKKFCTEGKYCDDIIADMAKHKNNPDKMLVDFKRIKGRNLLSEQDSLVSKPNGKIDINFEQGRTGDCWLLAGIASLCAKENGKNIVNSLLRVDSRTGDVIVSLKGVKKEYRITQKEINNSKHLSGGDGDLRALEIAIDKHIQEQAYNKELDLASQVDINGNTTHHLYEILVGNGEDIGVYTKDKRNQFNDNNKAFTLGASPFDTSFSDTINAVIDSKGNKQDFVLEHAYAIIKSDEEYVYLVNPWESKEVLRITHEKLEKIKPSIGMCSF